MEENTYFTALKTIIKHKWHALKSKNTVFIVE